MAAVIGKWDITIVIAVISQKDARARHFAEEGFSRSYPAMSISINKAEDSFVAMPSISLARWRQGDSLYSALHPPRDIDESRCRQLFLWCAFTHLLFPPFASDC